jgi:hypothetical protein
VAWDVLENTVIGTFIFGLGQAVGPLRREPIGVELLQQTPLDTSLGDVLIAKATFVRLIEFKRELNKSPKEQAKLVALKRLLVTEAYSRLELISRKVHWYVITNFNKWRSSVIVPYLDLESPVGDRDLAQFIQETADALAGPGMPEQELDDLQVYFQKLAQFCGSRHIGGTTGGLLFTVDTRGKPAYFPIRDVRELAMTPRQVVESRVTLERERREELSVQHERKYASRRVPRMSL